MNLKNILHCLCAFTIIVLINIHSLSAQNFETLTLPPIPPDSIQALQADVNNFAYPFYVSLDVKTVASTWIAGDSVHYALIIVSPGAYSLNVIFEDFVLPQGSQLTFFNADKQQREIASRSPYSTSTIFVSPLITGDTMILRIQEPLENSLQSRFVIGQISHGFKDIGIGTSRLRTTDCHININCPEAATWKTQKQSVCRLIIAGKRYCTGTLINNTAHDGTPYVLTANHCVANSSEAITTLFYFNYEYAGCTSTGSLPTNFNISGSELLATGKNSQLDFSLLRMAYTPPETFNLFYSGWNIMPTQPVGESCIHHPAGTAKRLALSDVALQTKTFEGSGTNFIKNSHWFISRWSRGTTEGGSSGAALLNANKQIIGTLTGGESTCENPQNDYFQQLSFAWDYFSEPQYQLKAWLDPKNSGAKTCDGFFPHGYYEASNIVLTDSITELNFGKKATGSWASSNQIGWTAFADKFPKTNDSIIYGIHILGKIDIAQNRSNIEFCVWEGNETPTKKLWSKPFDETMIITRNHVFISFDEPLKVSQNYWVGYETHNNSTAFTAFLAEPRDFGNSYFVYSPTHASWISSAELGSHTSMAIQLLRTDTENYLPPIENTAPEFIERLRSNALSHTTRELFETDSIAVFSAQTTMLTLSSSDVRNWSGVNEMNMTCFANMVRTPGEQLITGITAGINNAGNLENATTVYLWNSDLSEILYSKEIQNSRLYAQSANRIYFSQPIAVRDSFYIGVCYDKNQLNDTSSLFLIHDNSATIDGLFYSNSIWTKYRNFNLNYNLALQPITAFSPYLFNPNSGNISYYALSRQQSITIAENADCKIFPQPAGDEIFVQFLNTMFQSIDCSLIDLHGSLVWSGSVANTGGRHAIPLWQVQNGVYILQITVGNSTQQVKIVKAK
ncbi:MAG: T9SS type A sorting domain-containing protein [Bacteroidetes bacterium]|nr:T9SS type A sorting domain-containing protein [Bacteroidota bacterium]